MENLMEDLLREMKVELLRAVLDAEMVRSDFLSTGEKTILFPNKAVFFKFDFSNKENLYPDLQINTINLKDGTTKTVWSIEGADLSVKSNLAELIKYEIFPYLEDIGVGLKDIVGFYTSWLTKLRLTKRFDLAQKTIRFQAIPNDLDRFYVVFRMVAFEKVKKDEIYEVIRYTLKFEKIKRDIMIPLPLNLDSAIKTYDKITEEIESFLQEVSEEVNKILIGEKE